MAAEDHLAALAPGELDHRSGVLERRLHPPLAREGHRGGVEEPEVVGRHPPVHDPAEVVVEHLLKRCLARLQASEEARVLERLAATVDRPDLNAGHTFDDIARKQLEVARSALGARHEHEHAARLGRPDLMDEDSVELCRTGPIGGHLDHPLEGTGGSGRQRHVRGQGQGDEARALHGVPLRSCTVVFLYRPGGGKGTSIEEQETDLTPGIFRTGRRLAILLSAIAVLVLATPVAADAARQGGPKVTVMTRNVFLGADLGPALGAPTLDGAIDAAGVILNEVDETNFPERAKPLAREIANRRPTWWGSRRWRCGGSRSPRLRAPPTGSAIPRPRSGTTSSPC